MSLVNNWHNNDDRVYSRYLLPYPLYHVSRKGSSSCDDRVELNCFFSYSSESLNEDIVLSPSQHHFWTRIPSLPFIFIRMLYTLSLQPSLYNQCYHSTPDKSLVSLWITSVEYSYVYFPTNFNWPHSHDFQIDVGYQCNSSSPRHLTLLNNPDLYLSLF